MKMDRNRLLRKGLLRMRVLAVITLIVLFGGTIGWAATPYKLPKVIQWGSGDVGSMAYAISATMSEKMAPALGAKFRLIPSSEIERVYMLRDGTVQLAYITGDAYWATMGLSYYSTFALGPQPIRIIWAGWPDYSASAGIATATSGIKTPYDLKGKRVVQVTGAAWSVEGNKAHLAFANLTPADVTIIEVSTAGAGLKALAEGKVDYAMSTSVSPGVYEAESSPQGIYFVRFPLEDKQGWERYRKFMPYHVPGYFTKGPGIKPGEKIPGPLYPLPLTVTVASQSDEFVYSMCKAIYSKMDEIAVAYPGNEAMRPERAIIPVTTILAPYHPGAVKFFKEVGVWNEDLEAANKKRLIQMEKATKRWLVFTAEAQERMAKTGKKVDLVKEWREIVEKEVGLLP
jgi:uncharacterized protein